MKERDEYLAEELGLTVEEVEEVGISNILESDSGSSGEMPYGYYFYVPKDTPQSVLDKKGWSVEDRVDVSLNAFDSPDDHA
ncbi:hypothetical protein P3W43_01400 [Salinicola salarius]|uniref:hypothetical protein n=1 Tax=Salinicola salarius TaxID=430457 RepID=UPI0023E433DC|nr:hypothetical protein [Salinicola salarius]MDF3917504.1 hypothetical protein [Salinicola salarius]